MGVDLPAGVFGDDLTGGLLQDAAAAATDDESAPSSRNGAHDPAKTRAAAGDEKALVFEQIGPGTSSYSL